jgi:OOP family OmpA-OmpF porin
MQQKEIVMSRLTWAAAIALGLMSMPALAADDAGFYAGVGVGQMNIDFSGDVDGTPISFNDGDTAFRVFGGWDFNQYFAVEAAYVDGGTASKTFDIVGVSTKVDIDVTGWDVMLRGNLPMGESAYAFAEVGMIFWDAGFKATATGVSTTASDSGDDLAYGGGFGFHLGDNAGVRIEYVKYDISDANVDAIMASFLWKFR